MMGILARSTPPPRRFLGIGMTWLLVPLGLVAAGALAWFAPVVPAPPAPQAPPAPAADAERAPLTILHTIGNVGYIEPCG